MDDTTIPTSYKTMFRENLQLLLQQKASKLRITVDEGEYTGEGAMAVEQLQPTDVKDANDRYGDTPLIVPGFDARWVYPNDVEWGTIISRKDKLREVTDPTSALMQNAKAAFGRKIDQIIYNSCFADAKTGKNGSVTTAFPASQKVDVQLGGSGADVGLTYDKLLAAKELLLAADVDVDNDELWMVITSRQNTDLMKIAEIKGDQYNEKPVIVNGVVKSYMGFNFSHVNGKVDGQAIVKKTANNRLISAYAKSGIHLGRWNELETQLEVDVGKKYQPRPYAFQSFGATRVEEKKVVQIPCKE